MEIIGKNMKSFKKLFASAMLASSAWVAPNSAMACGSDPYIGDICVFAFTFCPRGFAEANGSLVAIQSNTALFALLGTTFGGNGQTTFALPDLRGRSAVGAGSGPGLTPVPIGQQVGAESTTLSVNQMPAHTHAATLRGANTTATSTVPTGNVLAKTSAQKPAYTEGTASSNLSSSAITVASAGAGQPVPTRSPGLGLITCIATQGIFPSRP